MFSENKYSLLETDILFYIEFNTGHQFHFVIENIIYQFHFSLIDIKLITLYKVI